MCRTVAGCYHKFRRKICQKNAPLIFAIRSRTGGAGLQGEGVRVRPLRRGLVGAAADLARVRRDDLPVTRSFVRQAMLSLTESVRSEEDGREVEECKRESEV